LTRRGCGRLAGQFWARANSVKDEPETSEALRLKMRFLRLLPIDGLL
jgi:hypothetical protein